MRLHSLTPNVFLGYAGCMASKRVAGKGSSRSAGKSSSKSSGAGSSTITARTVSPGARALLVKGPVIDKQSRTVVLPGGGKTTSLIGAGQTTRPEARSNGGGGKSRSTPADDPLAPARTRWLAEVVGGSGRLAALLGVSASQTSRWSKGQERPGVTVAPLLIDLEHVLARVRLVWADPAAGVWMTSANAYLEGARPIDVLQLSGPGPVLQALDAQAWGGAA